MRGKSQPINPHSQLHSAVPDRAAVIRSAANTPFVQHINTSYRMQSSYLKPQTANQTPLIPRINPGTAPSDRYYIPRRAIEDPLERRVTPC